MRQKKPHIVVAFNTLFDATALEVAAASYDIPGRSIPTPQAIDAGCGTAWAAPENARQKIESALRTHSLSYEAIYVIDLY